MRWSRLLLLVLLLLPLCFGALAQTIEGEVMDMDTHNALADVAITNVHTSQNLMTPANGSFSLAATHDELLEFRKAGYKTVRVRIPKGYVPKYFKIILQRGINNLNNSIAAEQNRYQYHDDSLRYRNIYKHELDFEKLSAVQSIAHPFSALSARNREIWRFQDSYAAFEEEKYVDKTFSKKLVTKVTGLKGDSLNVYLVRYRPSFEQLKAMSDYTLFSYIKRTVHSYRTGNRPRNSQ